MRDSGFGLFRGILLCEFLSGSSSRFVALLFLLLLLLLLALLPSFLFLTFGGRDKRCTTASADANKISISTAILGDIFSCKFSNQNASKAKQTESHSAGAKQSNPAPPRRPQRTPKSTNR